MLSYTFLIVQTNTITNIILYNGLFKKGNHLLQTPLYPTSLMVHSLWKIYGMLVIKKTTILNLPKRCQNWPNKTALQYVLTQGLRYRWHLKAQEWLSVNNHFIQVYHWWWLIPSSLINILKCINSLKLELLSPMKTNFVSTKSIWCFYLISSQMYVLMWFQLFHGRSIYQIVVLAWNNKLNNRIPIWHWLRAMNSMDY